MRTRLAAAATVGTAAVAALLTPMTAHADGGPVVEPTGTICWEKNHGTPSVTVRMSRPEKFPVTVVLDTIDGTAVAPGDYQAISGLKVTVPAGATDVAVPLSIVNDGVTEPDETFQVSLSQPSAGQIGKNPATVIIKDGSQP
ncbi:MAG: large repetitive protein [Actinoplanes sp.]|jgi:hypothetical protein|nr:large repetitive protein [Actinoplanes sp.]